MNNLSLKKLFYLDGFKGIGGGRCGRVVEKRMLRCARSRSSIPEQPTEVLPDDGIGFLVCKSAVQFTKADVPILYLHLLYLTIVDILDEHAKGLVPL